MDFKFQAKKLGFTKDDVNLLIALMNYKSESMIEANMMRALCAIESAISDLNELREEIMLIKATARFNFKVEEHTTLRLKGGCTVSGVVLDILYKSATSGEVAGIILDYTEDVQPSFIKLGDIEEKID